MVGFRLGTNVKLWNVVSSALITSNFEFLCDKILHLARLNFKKKARTLGTSLILKGNSMKSEVVYMVSVFSRANLF